MKNKLKPLFIVGLLFLVSCKQNPDTAGELMRLSELKFEWMIQGRMELVENVLHEQVRYIHSNGMIESKQDVIDNINSGKLKLESVEITEANVKVMDDLGIIIGKGKFKGVIDGNAFDVELLYTEVYQRISGRWLLLQRHANRLP